MATSWTGRTEPTTDWDYPSGDEILWGILYEPWAEESFPWLVSNPLNTSWTARTQP